MSRLGWISIVFVGGAFAACDDKDRGGASAGSAGVGSSAVAVGSGSAAGSAGINLATGWKILDGGAYGYRVASPDPLREENLDDEAQHLKLRRFVAALSPDTFGQIMYFEFTGEGPFDLEKGLDGACQSTVSGINGTMVTFDKLKDRDRGAREWTFTAAVDSMPIKGMGRAVAIGPKTIVGAMAFYKAKAYPGYAKEFMKSFEAK